MDKKERCLHLWQPDDVFKILHVRQSVFGWCRVNTDRKKLIVLCHVLLDHLDVAIYSVKFCNRSVVSEHDFKQLLDEVFVISRIIKVEVGIIITLTETLIILDITKTESNNCFIIHSTKKKWSRQWVELVIYLSTCKHTNRELDMIKPWSNGLASSRKLNLRRELRWVAKRWKTCIDLRENLISTKVIASHRKCTQGLAKRSRK